MPVTERREGVRERTHLRRPPKYAVVFLNDDFTPMDFVTVVLEQVFFMREDEAYNLMMRVHREGRAIAGVYESDIAYTKAKKTERLARENGFPLRVLVEEADD